jgi:hypothetical protein
MPGSEFNSYTLGILGRGVEALGRDNLADALGTYGGYEGLADALREINDGEFAAAADQLEAEANDPRLVVEKYQPNKPRELVAVDLHKTFTQVIGTLTTWTKTIGEAIAGSATPNVWFKPEGLADPLDIPKIEEAFDRAPINEQYRDGHKNNDGEVITTGGAAALKQQMAYVAAAETAYRLRHATSVRCTLHHAMRKEAHGHDKGIFQRIQSWLVDNIKAGIGVS